MKKQWSVKTKASQHCCAEEGESGILDNEHFKEISSLLVQHINSTHGEKTTGIAQPLCCSLLRIKMGPPFICKERHLLKLYSHCIVS